MYAVLLAAASHGTGAIVIGLIVLVLILVGIVAVLYMAGRGAKKVVDSATHHHDHQPGHS